MQPSVMVWIERLAVSWAGEPALVAYHEFVVDRRGVGFLQDFALRGGRHRDNKIEYKVE